VCLVLVKLFLIPLLLRIPPLRISFEIVGIKTFTKRTTAICMGVSICLPSSIIIVAIRSLSVLVLSKVLCVVGTRAKRLSFSRPICCVINCFLGVIAKYLVCIRDLLKFFLISCLRIWMILLSKIAIRLLDIFLSRVFRYAQHLIIIFREG
jgi:hypothetical protein